MTTVATIVPGTVPPTPAAVRGWTAGAVLEAVILGPAAQGGTRVLAAGREIAIPGSALGAPGTRLRLKLDPEGLPARFAPPAAGAMPAPAADPVAAALRAALPGQASIGTLLQGALAALGSDADRPPLPQAAVRLLGQLIDTLPQRERIGTAQGLREAIVDSGLLRAWSAGTGADPPARDWKGALGRLLAALEPARTGPPDRTHGGAAAEIAPAAMPGAAGASSDSESLATALASQARGALASIEVAQLRAAVDPAANPAVWALDIPVRDGRRTDVLALRVERETHDRAGEAPERRWAIDIGLDFPELGPIHARVVLFRGEIGTTFWARREDTCARLRERGAWLQTRCQGLGANFAAPRCIHGDPPAPRPAPARPPLVDARV
ncbi:MAG: flagellar hook-length control protein FliK [Gammaproteobacteria bacterium]